ncbi:hypothetical protein BDK51DRAFT_32096 [Blyttiomyces helicus]|uniref:DDE Tnp4 domain-containing protein n=1 Tax=Blyttiomyces helicus TaxID=388810 RepID=A0A4P9WGU6_9FUNG|nr:hypothetical protein BDK51DRAFT_32096 [Blyttiomyces helicus]|eukprot:RKO90270.1 hypothetical protein BDK51DRAFT_32096 [Blyttiomyces helicus]
MPLNLQATLAIKIALVENNPDRAEQIMMEASSQTAVPPGGGAPAGRRGTTCAFLMRTFSKYSERTNMTSIGVRPSSPPNLVRAVVATHCNAASFNVIATQFNVSQNTALKMTTRFVNAITEVYTMSQIAKAQSTVHTKRPLNDRWNGYINRKGFPSLSSQAVVDREGNFCKLYGHLPGSLHYTLVHRLSDLGVKLEGGKQLLPQACHLIGNSRHSLRKAIFTPYTPDADKMGTNFNSFHLCTSEITFASVVLHNLLNFPGAIYLKVWDWQPVPEMRHVDSLIKPPC